MAILLGITASQAVLFSSLCCWAISSAGTEDLGCHYVNVCERVCDWSKQIHNGYWALIDVFNQCSVVASVDAQASYTKHCLHTKCTRCEERWGTGINLYDWFVYCFFAQVVHECFGVARLPHLYRPDWVWCADQTQSRPTSPALILVLPPIQTLRASTQKPDEIMGRGKFIRVRLVSIRFYNTQHTHTTYIVVVLPFI